MRIETIKVAPWGEGQGEYVEINADEFDPKFHKHWPVTPDTQPQPRTKKGGAR